MSMPYQQIAEAVVVAMLGLAIGSFLNVVIYRLPRKKSLIRPPSCCPSCQVPIRWYQNIPVLSFAVLRGRCSACEHKISWRYPLVELVTAVLFLLFFFRYGLSITTVGFWVLAAMLVAVFFIDLDFRIIPDVITLPGIIMGLVFSIFSPHLSFVHSLIGVLAGGVTFLLLAVFGQFVFKKESLGGGDIKLAAMLGAFLGPLRIFFVFMASAVIGLLVSIIILAISPSFRRERLLPFGPFLVVAAFTAAFYGQQILDWYWNQWVLP